MDEEKRRGILDRIFDKVFKAEDSYEQIVDLANTVEASKEDFNKKVDKGVDNFTKGIELTDSMINGMDVAEDDPYWVALIKTIYNENEKRKPRNPDADAAMEDIKRKTEYNKPNTEHADEIVKKAEELKKKYKGDK